MNGGPGRHLASIYPPLLGPPGLGNVDFSLAKCNMPGCYIRRAKNRGSEAETRVILGGKCRRVASSWVGINTSLETCPEVY